MKISYVKVGDTLYADAGFDCLSTNQPCKVEQDGGGLFVKCKSGNHYLDGQLDFETGTSLVGFGIVELPVLRRASSDAV